jgi:hypothetical protein
MSSNAAAKIGFTVMCDGFLSRAGSTKRFSNQGIQDGL